MNIYYFYNQKKKVSFHKIKNRNNSSRQMFGKISALVFSGIATDFNKKIWSQFKQQQQHFYVSHKESPK